MRMTEVGIFLLLSLRSEYTFPWLSLTKGILRFGTKAGAFSMRK